MKKDSEETRIIESTNADGISVLRDAYSRRRVIEGRKLGDN